VLVWDAAHPGRSGLELGRHGIWVLALIGLPDGRVVSGDTDGWVLLWDPATPGADPIELGRHDHWVDALAVLPDGRVIAGGGHGQVHLWDLIKRAEITRVACTAVAFATATPDCQLVMAHGGGGISGWFIHVPKRGSCYRREAPAPLGVTGDQSAANEQPE
jgi:WD40 repeat protein